MNDPAWDEANRYDDAQEDEREEREEESEDE